MSVTHESIVKAAEMLSQKHPPSPMTESLLLGELAGARVFLKLENLQYTGSFKGRGALNRLSQMSPAERRRGIIAASAGNHAQGVAHHGAELGIQTKIVMPHGTPFMKIAQTEQHGAQIILHGETFDEAEAEAYRLAEKENLVFIHPFDDPAVISGQGTIALEMLEQAPQIDTLVVPVGGGGLIAGVAVAAKALKPEIRVIGVQSAVYPTLSRTHHTAGNAPSGSTIAEGIAVKTPAKQTRKIIESLVDDVVVVGEDETESAIQLLLEVEKTVAEGAGAITLAALFVYPELFKNRTCGLVISGGNIDSRLLASILMRGLARSGRIARFTVGLPDAPGQLAKVLQIIGRLGANLIEVQHQRLFHEAPIKKTEIEIILETRDPEHVHKIISTLAKEGYDAIAGAATPTNAVTRATALHAEILNGNKG